MDWPRIKNKARWHNVLGLDREEPIRMCVGCGAKKAKSALVRLAHGPDGFIIDRTGTVEGRGAYVCPSPDCIQAAVKNKRLLRKLGPGANDELDRLKKELKINR